MFLKKKKKKKTPFYKKRGAKITFLVLGLFLILGVSYVAYLYASGSRVFDLDNLSRSPFFKSIAGKDYDLKGEGDGRVNILFLGMGGLNHPGGTLTDTIMVMSINPVDKTMAMMSIPRDLYYPVEGSTTNKINEVYQVGERGDEGGGASLVKEEVGAMLDLPIHYYVTVDFYGFVEMIDAIGGVDVYVEKAIYDRSFPADDMKHYEPFYIDEGMHHMDGETALKYARSRKTSSDFDRAARQQQIINTAREKVLSMGVLTNPKRILDLVDVVGDHVKTDFSPSEIYALAQLFSELDTSKTSTAVLTNGPGGVLENCGGGYLCAKNDDYTEIRKIAHEIFVDPALVDENAKISVLNGTNRVGLAGDLAETLEDYNYNVVNIDNAEGNYLHTVIYDYSGGEKEVTLEFLQKRLFCDVIEKDKPEDYDEAYDVEIILGADFEGFKTNE